LRELHAALSARGAGHARGVPGGGVGRGNGLRRLAAPHSSHAWHSSSPRLGAHARAQRRVGAEPLPCGDPAEGRHLRRGLAPHGQFGPESEAEVCTDRRIDGKA
ncbi:unnamed protein product, partial [Effrenium voratum]